MSSTGKTASARQKKPSKARSRAATSAYLTRLFDRLPHPYLIVRADEAFTIVDVNASYLAATGTVRAAILGRGLFEVFPDNPSEVASQSASDLRASLERVLRNRTADVMGVQKYDIPARDGTCAFQTKYWSPFNTPVIEPDGSVSCVIHHVEDVTEFVLAREAAAQIDAQAPEKIAGHAERAQAEVMRRASELKEANRRIKESEAQLAELNEKLRDLNRLKTEFFANVSHEFRTPLTLLLGPLEELLRSSAGERSENELRATHEMMYRNGLRLLKLVNTLLEFARLEAQRTAPHWRDTDLAQFTTGIASGFQSLCQQGGLALRIDCPALEGPVPIDQEIWEMILLNLLSNAFKFTFEGHIEVRLHSMDGQIELCVADSGVGIASAELPHLFERFHRIQGVRSRSFEGSGIGLALVKELVELLGGTINVESAVGRGTCFSVRVPIKAASDSVATESGGTGHTLGAQPSALARGFLEEAQRWLPDAERADSEYRVPLSGGPLVLVVDDNADMRGYLCRLLRDAGYRVCAASEGAAALAVCESGPPDLVIADVMMPVMGGLELLDRLRADEDTADVPIMLLSALATEQFRSEGVRSGADDIVMKPFHAAELLVRVEAVLHRAAERKRADAQLRQAAAVFSGTNEAVIIADPERRIVAVNAAYTRITGFSAEEVIGLNPSVQKSDRHDAEFYNSLWQTLEVRGYWEGQIWNRRKNGEIYPAWENISAVRNSRREISHYVAVFSDIGSMKATEERLAHMAHHDALTDLPNRLLFSARLEQALAHGARHGKRIGLLLLDLDRFKLVNDTLGHAVGDQLLQAVAERLRNCVRAEDTVARLGGDEFAVVLEEMSHASDASFVAEKILEKINAPLVVEGKELTTSSSIGISIYPENARTAGDLVKAADAAMYRAKQHGRHAFEFYTPNLTAEEIVSSAQAGSSDSPQGRRT
jgi:diguanylate cyclase (GGDEF)-like protein/PAS domain S-box-containing protein